MNVAAQLVRRGIRIFALIAPSARAPGTRATLPSSRLASTHPQLSLHNADVTPTLPAQERAFARSEDALVAFLQVRTVQINPRPRASAETDARTLSCPLLA
jgi:hypothetical protein